MKELTLERFLQFLRRNDLEEIDKIVFYAYMNRDDERFKTLFSSYPGFEDVAYWFYGMINNLNFKGKFFERDLAMFFANFFWSSFNIEKRELFIYNKEEDKLENTLAFCPPNMLMYESNEDRFGGSQYTVSCIQNLTSLRREEFSVDLARKVKRLYVRGHMIWGIKERRNDSHVSGVMHSTKWLKNRREEFRKEGLKGDKTCSK